MAKTRRFSLLLTSTLLFISVAYFVLFIYVAFLRARYPYEVEWLEGAFMDHIMRLRDGLPIYTAPSIDYVPYLYTPLYYYVAAGFMSVFGDGFFAARLVSIVSTILSAGLIYRIVQRCGSKSRVMGIAGATIFIAAYGFGGFYYDTVRMDLLMVLFILLATASAIDLKGVYRSAFSALFLVAAYYTKQQALFAIPALCLWLFLQNRRSAVQFVIFFLSIFIILFLYFQLSSSGWFYYYTFEISRVIGKDFHLGHALVILPPYALRYWPFVVLFGLLFFFTRTSSWRESLGSGTGLVAMLTLAMLLSGIISMGNFLGYINLAIPFATFASILLPLSLSALIERGKISYSVALVVLLLQIGTLSYSLIGDKLIIPSEAQEVSGGKFFSTLRSMPGEVYVRDHSYISRLAEKKSHAHITAILNLLQAKDSNSRKLMSEFDSAYRTGRFSAIILDENTVTPFESIPGYTFTNRIFDTGNSFESRMGSWATRPQFIYLPSKPSSLSQAIH